MAPLIKKGLIAAAGLVAAVALERTNAPLWLLFGTVVLFLLVAGFTGWFLSSRKRVLLLGSIALVWVAVIGITLATPSNGVSVTINCAPVIIPTRDQSGASLFAIYLDPKWGKS